MARSCFASLGLIAQACGLDSLGRLLPWFQLLLIAHESSCCRSQIPLAEAAPRSTQCSEATALSGYAFFPIPIAFSRSWKLPCDRNLTATIPKNWPLPRSQPHIRTTFPIVQGPDAAAPSNLRGKQGAFTITLNR